jgi:hypothetical protein
MKKLVAVLAMFLSVQFLNAAPGKDPKEELTEAQRIRLTEIENRIEVIKTMDFGSMSKTERKDIKVELKEMKKEARELGSGVYISVGAIIIILLILILIV